MFRLDVLLLWFNYLVLLGLVSCEEQACSRYHYEAQTLERIISSEFKWKAIEESVEQLKKELETLHKNDATSRKSLDSMRSFCTADYNCSDVSGSECKWLTCKCKPGLSYHKASRNCLADCGQHGYGTTYQEERGAALKGLNNLIQTQVSLEECILLCSKESSFICRSVEYNSGTRSCHLSVETLYTKSDERYKLAPDGWDYFYTRDCN